MPGLAFVLKTQFNPEKGGSPISADGIALIAGKGVEGDWHQGRGRRDVCLIRKEILDWMDDQPVQGLCFGEHKENLLIEGFPDGMLVPNSRLQFREAVLEISDFPKHCFPDRCAFAQTGEYCKLLQEYRMAKILTSGVIYPGERVELISDPTVSSER